MLPSTQTQLGTVNAQVDEGRNVVGQIASPELPLRLSDSDHAVEYRRAETLESWRLLSDESCADYALTILEDIHAQGFELVEAGFMDVSGESWGCVFMGSNGESLSIMLVPERPFSSRSEANLLVVNILHYLEQESFA